jgi:hypothetical protein
MHLRGEILHYVSAGTANSVRSLLLIVLNMQLGLRAARSPTPIPGAKSCRSGGHSGQLPEMLSMQFHR